MGRRDFSFSIYINYVEIKMEFVRPADRTDIQVMSTEVDVQPGTGQGHPQDLYRQTGWTESQRRRGHPGSPTKKGLKEWAGEPRATGSPQNVPRGTPVVSR